MPVRFSRDAMRQFSAGLSAASIILATVAAADEQPVVEPLVCLVVDSNGRPVEDVEVGIDANFGITGNHNFHSGNDEWLFISRAVTDGNGLASLASEYTSAGTVVIARHSEKKLIGYSKALSQTAASGVTIQLQRAHQLSGTLTCEDLTQKGHAMPNCTVELLKDGRTLARYVSRNGKFSFPVSEGKFKLRCRGNVVRPTYQEVEITDAIQPEEVTVDLPAKRLMLLQGTVAPEFQDVIAWKNGPAIQPTACRDNYLLIDFWGHWCKPCLKSMPHLIDLHEEFAGKGLTIIGAHVDCGQGIGDVQKLDNKLSVVREQLWQGRDIPFPVALLRAQDVPAATRNDAYARSTTAAAYGVASYATCILVGPKGRIIQPFRPDKAADREHLRMLLINLHKI